MIVSALPTRDIAAGHDNITFLRKTQVPVQLLSDPQLRQSANWTPTKEQKQSLGALSPLSSAVRPRYTSQHASPLYLPCSSPWTAIPSARSMSHRGLLQGVKHKNINFQSGDVSRSTPAMQVFHTVLLFLFGVHWGVLGTWKAELPVFGVLFLKLGARGPMVFLRMPLWENFS